MLNMISESGTHSRSHGLGADLLKLQAQAMGVPIVQVKATWDCYEDEFKKTLKDLKSKGIFNGIFGDIDLQPHRDWVEKVCAATEIKPFLPLWNHVREDLLNEFIEAGFRAVVVAVNLECLGREWLGRQIDKKIILDLRGLGNIDLCGEKGEYHTFVYDGPLFKKSVKFRMGEKIQKDKHCFLDIKPG